MYSSTLVFLPESQHRGAAGTNLPRRCEEHLIQITSGKLAGTPRNGYDVAVSQRELERAKQRKKPKVQKTYRHQLDRKRARARMKDGELCWWCNRPMHRDQQLDADHVTSVHDGGVRADRMLHSVCNRQRREGGPEIDRRRPAAHADDAFPMLPIMLKSGKIDRRYLAEEVKAQVGEVPRLVELRKPFVW